MSALLSREDVLFHQRLLRQDGLYDGALDGLWGPKTNAADAHHERWLLDIVYDSGMEPSARTLAMLHTLTVAAAQVAVETLRQGALLPYPEIISGTRTYAEQSALFRRGRYGRQGPRVTNARAGQSWHNFGMAWDIGLFAADGSYIREEGPYREAGEWLMDQGIEGLSWGGHWKSFKDWPHYQLAVPWTIAEMRRRFEDGIPLEER